MNYEEALELLKGHEQEHVLKFYDELDGSEKEVLLDQISKLNWNEIALARNPQKFESGEISPIKTVKLEEIKQRGDEFEKAGVDALKEGKVAALLLAGGMGTRLGYDKPKGMFNVGINRELYIFECLINNLQKINDKTGAIVPLYIMTSEKNHEDTVAFFEEKNYYGYPKADVAFFKQEMSAAVDYDGKLFLEEKGRIATSPNGNGGWFSSMVSAGLADDAKKRGVEWINIFAVDNVLQHICDPKFIGATLLENKSSSSKTVKKADPHESLGVMCLEDGRPSVIEYYDMTEEMATSTDEDGELLYAYGVILNYLFRIDKLEEITEKTLPVHIVEKKIAHIDENGMKINPDKPNGYKFETLVVDMIRLMDDNMPYEVVREQEFAPIKNLHGVDSLDSARKLLEINGVEL